MTRQVSATGGTPGTQLARKQRTIAGPATVEGFGYWSGRDVRVQFRPAPPDAGIVFIRSDMETPVRIQARVHNRLDVPRRTALAQQSVTVEMVEHVLAALGGLSIDNCEVWVDSAEMPGMDGSSLTFVNALDGAGISEQAVGRPQIVVSKVIRVADEDGFIEAHPSPLAGSFFQGCIDYGSRGGIGKQSFELAISPDSFRRELAPARTFLLVEEAEELLARGLCQRVSHQEVLVFGPSGLIKNKLRFPDECVRHKLLDLVGDLTLAGVDVSGRFVAHRSSHRLNAELVKAVLAEFSAVDVWRHSA